MSLTPELQAAIEAAADESAKRTRSELFGLLGVEEDDEGRKALKALGDFACLWSDIRCEARKQGIRGTVKALFWTIKLLVLGGFAYLAWRAGWVGK
jgi:hypothetical protein